MIRSLALLLVSLLAFAGCETTPDAPAPRPESGDVAAVSGDSPSLLADRVWMRSDLPDLPGSMQVFLSDGTLVMDSCWETYRIETWTAEADSVVRWQEDGQDVRAAVVSLAGDELMLRVNGKDQAYAVASTPYLCPDMPR